MIRRASSKSLVVWLFVIWYVFPRVLDEIDNHGTDMDQEENITKRIFSERLRSLMALKGLTQKRLSEKAECTQSAVSNYLNSTRIPGAIELKKLARALEVSMDDLVNERQEAIGMGASNAPPGTPRQWGGTYFGTSDEVPLVASASAGTAREFLDLGEDVPRIKTACRDGNAYALKVEGDSMEPIFKEGDVLVVSPQLQATAGDLVVVKNTEDEAFFKKYVGEKKGKFRFASFNAEYPVIEMTAKEVRFIHPVHSVIRPFKGKIF